MAEAKAQIFCAEILDVFSGDDLIVMIDLGVEDLYKKQRIRLHGVDTPNAIGEASDTEAGRVRSQVRSMLNRNKLHISVQSKGANSWVAVVEFETPEGIWNLNDILVNQGYDFKRKR